MIEVTNLTKSYGNHIAVNNLSFRVEKGQIYGFLGPNGAGKSTTMNIITGYLAASSGTVSINGRDVLKEPEEAKKHIGYLPELPPLYMDMTVWEYLKFVAELKKVAAKEQRAQIEEIMRQTGIYDMKHRLIKNLSKGYKQRVGLAQALIGYPEVIILDEPSVGLDPKQIIEMREFIRSLAEKHTVILSSHILSEVSAVCDHIMIISKGKLVASDSPENLQHLMGGSSELEIVVRGDETEVMEVLSTLEYAQRVDKGETPEPGCVKVNIITDKGVDVREQVFYKLAAANLPIMFMAKMEKSLEDIFLELTGKGGSINDCNL
ncbi:MAG: ABC transporter ATP-binding protein [Lachnospiraceae bacterium]|nr:ABC transporter ATP-binding protein [Lachnospiraceae bacterium]